MSVFGTRPEAIKMSVLIQKMEADAEIQSVVCVTAQHREMLDQVLRPFSIRPDYDLNLMKPGQSLSDITARVLQGLDPILLREKPDLVLVHGDTASSVSAALAAFYHQIPVGHVEAGLRTYSRYSPFPEEMNRQIISRIATLHFSPTAINQSNLKKENITRNVYVTGNTAIDVVKSIFRPDYQFQNSSLRQIHFGSGQKNITVTAHRRENIGGPLRNICLAVKEIARSHPDARIIWPVHPNPSVHETVCSALSGIPNICLTDPLGVFDMHNLIGRSYFVMTDSGGLQEEAPSLGKPVLVLRTETERPEAVEAGTAMLAGVRTQDIVRAASQLLDDPTFYRRMANAVNPFGDGHAAERIIRIIKDYFQDR
jgi:UDP-N-acetylglucosamine 2-epimerase